MLKKTMTFVDFDGNERTETFYFNMTKAEALDFELTTSGGMARYLARLIEGVKTPEIIAIFKDIILNAYGEKSPVGREFIKNDEIRNSFKNTEAFSDLYLELATDAKAAADFLNGVLPRDFEKIEAPEDAEAMKAMFKEASEKVL